MQRAIGRGERNLVVGRNYRNTFGTQRLSALAEFGEVRSMRTGSRVRSGW